VAHNAAAALSGGGRGWRPPDAARRPPQWGEVKDIIVLKDKATGQPRGCAFVSYAAREEAEAAVAHLDRRVQLPGAAGKLEVGRRAPGARRRRWA
jgi:hypothetical protein